MIRALLISGLAAFPIAADTRQSDAQTAIEAFNSVCFKAGQTTAQARARMETLAGAPLPFGLTFWDVTLEPAPAAPETIERRCEVSFAGHHSDAAIAALRIQMATPPVFGHAIDLPQSHAAEAGTALIQARELLRGRVAVVHVATRNGHTIMAVDRLPAHGENT